MLYITLNSKKIKRVILVTVFVMLFAVLFCLWAVCCNYTRQQNSAVVAVSSGEPTPSDPVFTVLSAGDVSCTDLLNAAQSDAEAVLPAYASLLPFSLDQKVAVPLESAFVSSEFGFRDHPINGRYSFHSGLDLAAPEGTAVHAMLDGVVTTAEFASDYGNYVILDHGNFQTLYAHCLSLCVASGDLVEKGQQIGQVGATGSATGNHLHVEFRCDGVRYDPSVVLGDSYS